MRYTEIQHALGACRGSLLVLTIFSFCINLLALASPLYMLQLYDRVLSSRSIDTLIMLMIIVIAALGLMSLLDGLRRLMLPRIAAWFDDRLGPVVLAGALDSALCGDDALQTRGLRDLDTVRGFLSGSGVMPLMDIPWTPLFIAALFLLHPLLGAIGAASATLLFGLGILNETVTRAVLREVNALMLRNQRRAETTLRNAEVIRAMGLLDGILRIWQREGNAAKAAQLLASDRGAVILAVSKFFRLAVQTLIMGAGAWLVIEDNGSAGTIFASSFLLSRALAPVESAIGTWKSFITARLAYRRLVDLLVQHPVVPRGMTLEPPNGELVVERLAFVPPGTEVPTLRQVSFGLAAGEVLGIVGPSAAGKSTLARLVAGTWRPAAGHVRLDGADISVWHDSNGSRHIGYLPQDVELFAGTVRDNIARFQDADPAVIVKAAKLVGVHEAIMRLPRGYDSEIGDAGIRLSGGQRQRLGLARAVFGSPRLVILDEPNSSLDHEGEKALYQAIAYLKSAGTTVLLITHRAPVLSLADKLLVLRDGAVQTYGRRTDVVAALNAAAAAMSSQENATLPDRQPA